MEKALIKLNRQFNEYIVNSTKNQKNLIEVNQRLKEELEKKEIQLQNALNDNKVLKEKQKKNNKKMNLIKERIEHDIEEIDYKNKIILKYFDDDSDNINYYKEVINERNDKLKIINKGLLDKIKENNTVIESKDKEILKLKELLKNKIKELAEIKKQTGNQNVTHCAINFPK